MLADRWHTSFFDLDGKQGLLGQVQGRTADDAAYWLAGATPAGPIPDLVNRDFPAEIPGRKMVGDIAYIPTRQGWAFLATVIDCAARKVIGWAVDDNYRTPLITSAIQIAARNVNLPADAVFHSDTVYPTTRKARDDIARHIELRYNRTRFHSALGYRTPREVHDEYLNRQRAA